MVLNRGGGQLLFAPICQDLQTFWVTTSVTKESVCGAIVEKVNSKLHSSLATQTLPSPPETSEAQTFKSES